MPSILLITAAFPPSRLIGGRRPLRMATGLAARGWQVTAVGPHAARLKWADQSDAGECWLTPDRRWVLRLGPGRSARCLDRARAPGQQQAKESAEKIRQAYQEVFEQQMEEGRLRAMLERIQDSRIIITHPQQLTPFCFPVKVDSLREVLSSEKLEDRVRRMQSQLEK